MYAFLTILIVIAAILLILIVLVQNSKGGGLASNFQSSNQYMGVRGTADFLEKATWTLATVLVGLSILASISSSGKKEIKKGSLIENQIEEAIDPSALPNIPTNIPAQQQEEE